MKTDTPRSTILRCASFMVAIAFSFAPRSMKRLPVQRKSQPKTGIHRMLFFPTVIVRGGSIPPMTKAS